MILARKLVKSLLAVVILVAAFLSAPQVAQADGFGLSLTADNPSLAFNQLETRVTARFTPQAGYRVVLFRGSQAVCSGAASCSESVAPAHGQSVEFTANVTNGGISDPSAVVASTTLVVTRARWHGQLSLTSETYPSGHVMLIANTTQDVGYGYSIFIRDQNRNRVATCNGGSNCTFYFQPPQDSIRYFDAVVQRRTEPSDEPASDWKVVTRGLDDDELMSSSDIDTMAAQLIAASGSELAACLALGEAVRTHAAGSSVPDVTLVCTSKGLATAIRFAGKLNRAGNVFKVVNAIGAAIHAPNPTSP